MSTLSGENFNLCLERECDRPNDMVDTSSGRRPGIKEGRWFRIDRYKSVVVESETSLRESWGSLLIAFALRDSARDIEKTVMRKEYQVLGQPPQEKPFSHP